jgi:hypothetical protein
MKKLFLLITAAAAIAITAQASDLYTVENGFYFSTDSIVIHFASHATWN